VATQFDAHYFDYDMGWLWLCNLDSPPWVSVSTILFTSSCLHVDCLWKLAKKIDTDMCPIGMRLQPEDWIQSIVIAQRQVHMQRKVFSAFNPSLVIKEQWVQCLAHGHFDLQLTGRAGIEPTTLGLQDDPLTPLSCSRPRVAQLRFASWLEMGKNCFFCKLINHKRC